MDNINQDDNININSNSNSTYILTLREEIKREIIDELKNRV